MRKTAEKEDESLINLDELEKILLHYGFTLQSQDKSRLLMAFPGRTDGGRVKVNISKLLDQKYNTQLQKLY